MKIQHFLPLVFLFLISIIFFIPFIFSGKLPIPSDTIVGLYHPFRDFYQKDYPRGIPFKNFLITDPVRQQYPWRSFTIQLEKTFQLPLWNPYNFAGSPHLANFQSAPFYPLNILLFIFPFSIGWSLLVILQPLLAGMFMYLFLSNLKLNRWACSLGSLSFAFCGFSIAWFEWNTIVHVGLWLPLLLVAKDHLLKKISFRWVFVFLLAECSAVFAGHLQTYFYFFLVSNIYLFVRIFQISTSERKGTQVLIAMIKRYIPFLILGMIILFITFIQWYPAFRFIQESARNVDQLDWHKEGWFIPWQHLVQFIAPDFFGNPTTLNYWGVWNYGEFVGYVGLLPLVLSIYALFFRHDKKTLFFGSIFFLSLLFSLPTFFAKLPYIFNIPFISTSQPTRLLFVADFSLSILTALGFDYFLKKKKQIIYPSAFLGIIFLGLWIFVLFANQLNIDVLTGNLDVSKRNLYLPTVLFGVLTILLLVVSSVLSRKFSVNRPVAIMIYIIIATLTVADLLRFATKFTPFTNKEYLFPQTKVISFLQKNLDQYRFMTTDSRIFPPNFSVVYHLQSLDGYDPLYLKRYGELIAASERGEPNISPPLGFNRIITPHNYDSKIIDLLGVKYVLSLSDLTSPKLKKVFQEGKTRIYENKNVLPRTFFVERTTQVTNKNKAIEVMFKKDFDPMKIAVYEDDLPFGGLELPSRWETGIATIIEYSENKIVIETKNNENGFLVLTDTFYPIWHVKVDNDQTKIYRTDYNFRGIVVPAGKHMVVFYTTLL